MRIAHVAPPAGGSASGILTVLAHLTTALVRRGHDVALWHEGDWSAPGLRKLTSTLDDGGVHRVHLDTTPRRGRALPTVSLPAETVVDVVHLHSVFVLLNAAVARTWNGPLVFSPHGGYDPVSLSRSFLRKQVYSALYEKRMVRRATAVAALTEVEAAQIRDFAGPVMTAVIPNGVAEPVAGRGTWLRDRIRMPRDARLAVFVGRLDVRHKGLDRLVQAAAAAPSWHVLLVGPDHRGGRDQLARMIAKTGVAGRVHFMGPLEPAALGEVHAAADLFVLPSRWEGQPMSLLEALAQGTPALVSPEVDRLVPVSAAGAGWVSASEGLGRVLEGLAGLSPDEWSSAGGAARALARGYDWDTVAAAYEDLYGAARRRWAARAGAVPRTARR
jgi:glycosyltransferase involved in cell wall biosynthesis